METLTSFTFLGSKITAYCDCRHEIKTHLLLGKKAVTKLYVVLKKQRHHFTDKGPYSLCMFFAVVIYGCESCNIKKAEC